MQHPSISVAALESEGPLAELGFYRKESSTTRLRIAGFFSTLAVVAGCSDATPEVGPPIGPPGAMIEVDAGTIGGSGGSAGGGGSGGRTQLLNGGIGRICDSDADCPNGLTCNIDTVDWIAHRQCSTYCETSEFCEDNFGDYTMCIGANLCVSKCLDETHCPESTLCNSNDWCENSGLGSGVPKCAGTPTPCSLLGEFECASSLGCSWSADCSGAASSCYLQYDSFSCTSQDGCYWSSSSSSCSGSATSCRLLSAQYLCTSQDGCYWNGSCIGTPLESTCDEIAAALCDYTPGCTLVPQQ
jgi:hypothetical protein